MLKVKLHKPQQFRFQDLKRGDLFDTGNAIMIKTTDTAAVFIHCMSGQMNQEGLGVNMREDAYVTRIKEAEFTVG